MSRVFVDDDLLSWEAYASGGKYGLPEVPMIVFQCKSDPGRRARFVRHDGDNADAERVVHTLPEADLREILRSAEELE